MTLKQVVTVIDLMDMPLATISDTRDRSLIERAAYALRCGELVVFPTETVYGLGADASNPDALRKLFKVKGRPSSHPVIVHISKLDELSHWASTIPEAARKLADAFWPGPLTLVLPKADSVLDLVTGCQKSVGVRIPSHPTARALLKAFAGGIAAPSANRFGRLSPTTAEDVVSELGNDVAMVLDGGPCKVGIESTIVDLTGERPVILRPGMILPSEIERVLGYEDYVLATVQTNAVEPATRAPGGLPSHYAPETAVMLVQSCDLAFQIAQLQKDNKRVAVLAFQVLPGVSKHCPWVVAASDPCQYAHDLYRHLRFLDWQSCDLILVESTPDSQAWMGIRDRISRAASAHSSLNSGESK